MKKGKLIALAALLSVTAVLGACGFSESDEVPTAAENTINAAKEDEEMEDKDAGPENEGHAVVMYMGQGSLRITTPEKKIIYIDPFSGEPEWYEPAADLILVTHDHPDHNKVELIENRNEDCQIITQDEAIIDGKHQSFDLSYVGIEAVEAENENHNINECVGYILTFSDGQTLYACGDTSTTRQMAELAERHLDYAFFCCDGRFNMDTEEASECARLVAARHSIPYHMAPGTPNNFDREKAEQFQADGRIILEPGEELTLEED